MLYNLLQNQDVQNFLLRIRLFDLIKVIYELEFRAFVAVVVSFLVMLLFGRRTIHWLLKQKIGDAPEFYNKSLNELMARKANTPTMGGLLVVAAIAFTVLMLADLRNFYVLIGLVVLLWLGALGAWDDWLKLTSSRRTPAPGGRHREGLFAWEKLLFQLGLGLLVGVFLFIHEQDVPETHALTLPFQRTYIPGSTTLEPGIILLSFPVFVMLTTLVIAATSNAVNLTDGMDGLAPGTLIVSSLAFMTLCYIAGTDAAHRLYVPFIDDADEMMIITGAMAGACLGFLWFNCSPALVFMGDTGSLPLGGLLAYIAVVIRQEVLLLIVGGVFFMEMASVIVQVGYFKWTKGKRIFLCSPVHHHFHLKGWSEQQVVIRFWVLAVVFAAIALVSIKLR
jgi:phospho-N-acetylmuramoyl-pentapeptide-transferase